MSWLRKFVIACAFVLTLVITALLILVSYVDLGLSSHGIVALFLGAMLPLALGMVLMGLVFMSSRRGYDESAYKKSKHDSPISKNQA